MKKKNINFKNNQIEEINYNKIYNDNKPSKNKFYKILQKEKYQLNNTCIENIENIEILEVNL